MKIEITLANRKTLLEGLVCLEENLTYEDFDHLDLPGDDEKREVKIEELREQQETAIEEAAQALRVAV